MKICPRCKKPVEAKDKMSLSKKFPLNKIHCSCGYEGLPIEVEPEDSKRD